LQDLTAENQRNKDDINRLQTKLAQLADEKRFILGELDIANRDIDELLYNQ